MAFFRRLFGFDEEFTPGTCEPGFDKCTCERCASFTDGKNVKDPVTLVA
jgi:hypothetical protein